MKKSFFYLFHLKPTQSSKTKGFSNCFIIVLFLFTSYGCGNNNQTGANTSNYSNYSNDSTEANDLDKISVDTIYDTSVSAKIDKVWSTREIKQYGNSIYGVTNVHCHFTIENYKGRTGSVVVYIEPQYSENRTDGYYTYNSFTSKYEASEFKDFWVTIKDQDIKYSFGDNGDLNYKVRVAICDDENNKLTESNYIGISLPEFL